MEGFFKHQTGELSKDLQESGQAQDISKTFAKLSTDQQRVNYVLNLESANTHLRLPELVNTKSSAVAQDWRAKGNKAFQLKDYGAALRLYTNSIASAPVPGASNNKADVNTDLALAFANRSAALFHLQKYQECLDDIDHATDNNYPPELKYKLLDREGKCHLQLGDPIEAGYSFDEAMEILENAKLDDKRRNTWEADLKKQIGHCVQACQAGQEPVKQPSLEDQLNCQRSQPDFIEGTNATFPSLSSACDVVYTKTQGRFITAKKDISPGELVLIEKPFASVLLPEVGQKHCHHCCAYTDAPIPCLECSQVLYCGPDCRHTAWLEYHAVECPILPAVHSSGVGKFGYLALRSIVKACFSHLLQLRDEMDVTTAPELAGCNASGVYLADDYTAIRHLVTHDEDRTAQDLFDRAVTAAFLLKSLQKTQFFKDESGKSLDLPENLAFVGGLILSHLQAFPCNAHEISEMQLDKKTVATSETLEVGAGIYSTLSLFNHSCDPAVNRNFYGDTCVVRAIKTIKAGDEIADNYGAVYAMQSRVERQMKLKPQYYFQCQCPPCLQDWPLYADIESCNPKWKCGECGAPLQCQNAKDSDIQCTKCQHTHSLSTQSLRMQKSSDCYTAAFQQLLQCQIEGALPVLLRHLVEMQELVALPWQEFNNCQEAVKQCFSIMGNCHVITP